MLTPLEEAGNLRLFLQMRVIACEMDLRRPGQHRGCHGAARRRRNPALFPRYALDATDLGDVLALCGKEGEDWTVGANRRRKPANPTPRPNPAPTGYSPSPFPLRWNGRPIPAIQRHWPPHDYEELKAQQDYKILHGAITGLFAGRAPWWQYRRILAADNFEDPRIPNDIAIINTAGNDYYGGNILGPDAGTAQDIEATLARARRASLGYAYWLQTECPREEEEKKRRKEEEETTASERDKLKTMEKRKRNSATRSSACAPTCSTRRTGALRLPTSGSRGASRSLRPILEQEIVVKDFQDNSCRGEQARAAFMPDSVGVGHYALDIHPNGHGEPNHYVATRPFQIPLGALIPVRLKNLLPACKNIGTTHLTNGAYRLHPIEWNIGESAVYWQRTAFGRTLFRVMFIPIRTLSMRCRKCFCGTASP